MRIVRLVTLIAAASVISGCAMGHTRQDLARLQSQVGLLDERVSQLERTNLSGPSTASTGEIAPDFSTATVGAAVRPAKKPLVSAAKPASVSSSTSSKPSTREVQEALKNAGFYQGPLDGKMGPLTREAIQEFQRVHGLNDDGVAGKQTWAKLSAYADLSAADANKK